MSNKVDGHRRRFLKVGLGGALVLSVGGGLLGWRVFGHGYDRLLDAGDQPIALSVKEFAVAKALVRALLPAEDGFPAGESLRLAQRIDEEVWVAPPPVAADLKAGLLLIEHATLAYGHASRFTALAPVEGQRYFARLLQSGNGTLALVALAYKEMIHLFYFGNPAVWGLIGYDGPLVEKAVPPDSAVAYAALLRKRGNP